MIDTSRQDKLINRESINSYSYKIFGIGNVGGLLALTLAKIGVKDIEVYDYDTVDSGNEAPQIYGLNHIGQYKVTALYNIIKDQTNVEIKTNNIKIVEETEITPEPNTMYICGIDTIAGRKILFDKVKDLPVIFIDSRIGSIFYRFYLVDLGDDSIKTEYEKTLDPQLPDAQLDCGEKGAFPINMELVSKMSKNIKLFTEGENYTQILINAWDTGSEHEIRNIKER